MERSRTMQTKEKDEWKLINCNCELHDVEDEENCKALLTASTSSKFKFPPPPRLPVLLPRRQEPAWQSVSDTETNSDSQSDQPSNYRKRSSPIPIPKYKCSSSSSNHHFNNININNSNSRGYQSDGSPVRNLPPIGVFWDIENCQIPRGKSAVSVAQAIRDKFFAGYREAEFLVVCDVKKETPQVVKELNDAQINLIHVDATCKNAADEKLRMSMRRFADTHGSSAAIVLISGDVNFAPDLCDLRHRKKIYVILLHLDNCATSLILCANEHYSYSELAEKLPYRAITKPTSQLFELVVNNLPINCDPLKVRARLKRLAENCGGRIGQIIGLTTTVRFPTLEYALRAKKRMEGEKVFGNAISLGYPRALPIDGNSSSNIQQSSSPMKPRFNMQRRKMDDNSTLFSQYQQTTTGVPTTAIVQYMGPASHQTVGSHWQTTQHIHPSATVLGIYGGGHHLMQLPHMTQQAHLTSMPTIIHTHGPACTSQQTVDGLSGSHTGALTSSATCISACRTSAPGIWSYNNTSAVTSSGSPASAANSHRILTNISNHNTVQNQIFRGRPILGTHNVINEHLSHNVEIDKKQLQSESVLQWLHKSNNKCSKNNLVGTDSNNDVSSSTQTESCAIVEDCCKLSDINKITSDNNTSATSTGYMLNSINNIKQQTKCRSSSPLNKSKNIASNKQWQPLQPDNSSNSFSREDSHSWSRNKTGSNVNRRCRTPSPYTLIGVNLSIPSSTAHGGNRQNHCHSDSEKMFNPIASSSSSSGSGNSPVELHVTNLDQNIDPIEMKKILMNMFQENVMVLHVSVFVQSGGNLAAVVKVPTQQDAQYAISQLHRRKIGYKRIMISYARSSSPHNPQVVRSQVIAILLEVPGHQLPLFKFREMFESRYLNPISASDLNRLRDICEISEGVNGRTILLNKEHYKSTSPQFPSFNNQDSNTVQHCQQQANQLQQSQQLPAQQQAGFLVCTIHARILHCSNDKGWAEQETPGLPCLRVALAEFTSRIHALIHSHNNMLPLTSLCDCYEAEFGSLKLDENGVPLEHLLTCVSGVELQVGDSLAKYLRAAPKNSQSYEDKSDDSIKSGTVSPSLAYNLHVFSKELVDLLKSQPHCVLSFNKFIPAYHHHFRRQCRVADYGFTRLIDLFEAMPNIIQIMGEGNKRTLTLTHRSQMRRFSTDLLRVLRSHSSKQVNIKELPVMFERHLGKTFDPVDYGLCYLTDLLSQLMENTVVISNYGGNMFVAIPKRDQTVEEIERTKLFAQEVIELMSHSPQYSLLFERFIPAYHHHFGHQCRVSDFGFTKLIELFEAIPEIVKIEDVDGERRVTLTNAEKLKVLSEQVADLVQVTYPPGLPLSGLCAAFQWQYGYALKPSAYNCNSLNELITELNSTVKLVELEFGLTIVPVDQAQMRNLSLRVWRILMETSKGKMTWSELEKIYLKLYKQNCSLDIIRNELKDTVKIHQDKSGAITVQLTSLQLFARDVYRLLCSSDGKLAVSSFETAFLRCFDTAVQPAQYGFNNLISLLQAIPHVVILRGKGVKRLLILNKVLASAGISLPPGFVRNIGNVKNNCTSEVENKDPNSKSNCTAWPAVIPPSESLLKGLIFPNETETTENNDDTEEGEQLKTPPNQMIKFTRWNSTSNDNESSEQDIIVHLPKFDTPPPPSASLISPCKYLLQATIQEPLTTPQPPDPSQLPKIFPFKNNDESNPESEDSGVNKLDIPRDIRDSEGSCSGSDSGTPKNNSSRRKLRLAAQFHTPIELEY
ncbi:meiosis regulator and mRNA stability factor 1-like protein [Lycorma delicatula]|uniref:meiosis regulator and mRNA stability factor 1-like protein n=1 Tax=Lycorma delicatula TaxID=130591 RepID=UPI003F5125FB